MASAEEISRAYLESYPEDAARVLEQVTIRSVAALFAELPVRISVPVLRAMMPVRAARCLKPLDDEQVAGILAGMGAQAGAAILQNLPESRRSDLLTLLPTTMALAYRLLLSYPEDSVGAWMDPGALMLSGRMTVAETLEQLRDSDEGCDEVYVVDQEQRLCGQVTLGALLRAKRTMPLASLMEPVAFSLPARSRVKSIAQHRGWDFLHSLAVLERGGRLVGVLGRDRLRVALRRDQETVTDGRDGELLAELAGGYWTAVSALMESLVTLLPAPPDVGAKHDG